MSALAESCLHDATRYVWDVILCLAHLQLIKRILRTANLVQCHPKIASQHAGALVDMQAASEMILCHLILLLPEVYLTHTIPEEDMPMSKCSRLCAKKFACV